MCLVGDQLRVHSGATKQHSSCSQVMHGGQERLTSRNSPCLLLIAIEPRLLQYQEDQFISLGNFQSLKIKRW